MALFQPHSEQAERAVIGAVLLDEKQVGLFTSVLIEDDFYNENYKTIYKVICKLAQESIKVDVTSVSDYLNNIGQLNNIGGIEELISLTDSVVSTNIFSYINILQEKTNLRSIAKLIEDTTESFDSESLENTDAFLRDFEEKVLKITRNKHFEGFMKTSDLINKFNQKISSGKPNEAGLTTGYTLLDSMLNGGWQKGNLIVLGARPGTGKTAIGLNFALNAAKRRQTPVLFFSLEMSGEELTGRLISMTSNVDGKKIQLLRLNNEDLIRVENGCRILQDLPIYFDDTPNIKLGDLEKKARLFKQQQPELGLIIIDYMQILNVEQLKGQSRENQVAKISIALKALARDIDVPIIALAQLNRGAANGVEFKRKDAGNKKPEVHDLRESGQIEQDADVILLLHRDANQNEDKDAPEKADLLLRKNRNGQTGDMQLVFTAKYQKFDNMDRGSNEV